MADDDEPDDQPDDLFPAEPEQANAANPAAIRRQRTRSKIQAKQGAAFWRMALSTKSGRHELYRVLESSHAFEDRFACGPNGFPQPEATWFQAGEKGLGQRLFLTWLRIDRDGVFLMLDENDPRFAKPIPQSTKLESD